MASGSTRETRQPALAFSVDADETLANVPNPPHSWYQALYPYVAAKFRLARDAEC